MGIFFNRKKKRYYREWMQECGWGVMMGYDTIMAYNARKAASKKVSRMYKANRSFELIKKVEKKHLHLSDDELSKIYGIDQ